MTTSETAMTAEPDAQPSEAELRAARTLTKKWIVIGWSSFAVAFGLAWVVAPRPAAIAEPVDRLLLALQLAAGPSIVMFLILQGLWRVVDTPQGRLSARPAPARAGHGLDDRHGRRDRVPARRLVPLSTRAGQVSTCSTIARPRGARR